MIARSRKRGFALTVALVAIVIIGALIVGVFFAATQEYRIGRNTVLQARSLTAAEYGLNDIVSTGNGTRPGTLRVSSASSSRRERTRRATAPSTPFALRMSATVNSRSRRKAASARSLARKRASASGRLWRSTSRT